MLWTLLVISLISFGSLHFHARAADDCIPQNEIQLSGKPTFQSSNYTPDKVPYVSNRAIDKNEEKCAHTNSMNNSWWTIDLGSVYNISCISIYNKIQDNIKMEGAKIHIGNSKEKNGLENKVWKNITVLDLDKYNSFTFDEVVLGRYVTVTVQTGHVVLCEVKIYQTVSVFELVKEKKTWEDALYSCRETGSGYRDLATIHDNKTQAELIELVKNATTEFVWLGFRYTCTLDFWFWVNDGPKNFQNWAEDEKECDRSAAMTKDGLWHSKPDNQEYNFICTK